MACIFAVYKYVKNKKIKQLNSAFLVKIIQNNKYLFYSIEAIQCLNV